MESLYHILPFVHYYSYQKPWYSYQCLLMFSLNNAFFPVRVHKLFLFDDTLKKEAKFSFAHFIAHKNPETGNRDMKVG